jgi:phage shock protein C
MTLPQASPPVRRLYRSRTDRMLGGVAGGLAAYFEVDPVLVRLGIAALFFAGIGFLAYIVAWIIIPEEPLPQGAAGTVAVPAAAGASAPPDHHRGAAGRGVRLVLGTVLVAVGIILLLGWALPDLFRFLWPAAIIVAGLAVLSHGVRR